MRTSEKFGLLFLFIVISCLLVSLSNRITALEKAKEVSRDGVYNVSRSGGYIGTLAPGQSTNIHITILNHTTNNETIG